MDSVTKKEYKLRDLGTKSVTLFPTRAQVVREIKDVPLAPGANEITIVGLTPTVEEHSIKVDGTGAAIISDIAVELLPNREIFQEIYPDSDTEDEEEEDDDDDDDSKDSAELCAVRDKLVALRDERRRAEETVSSADTRLRILDAYGKQLDRKKGVNIEDGLETYRAEREKVFRDQMAGQARERELDKQIDEAVKEENRLEIIAAKERAKAEKVRAKIQRAKEKEREKKRRRVEDKASEKARIRKEREHFWPKFCYSVRITLDATAFTPMSSRRASIASDVLKPALDKAPQDVVEGVAGLSTCDLSLTYVTTSAFWSPSYDLQLSTTTAAATLCFDAQLTNATSEVWSGCRVTLSTSQTTFAGLEDAIPQLVPWRIKLVGKGGGYYENELLDSREERSAQGEWKARQVGAAVQKPRANLFGAAAPQVQVPQQPAWMAYQALPVQAPPPPAPMMRAAAPGSSAVAFGSKASDDKRQRNAGAPSMAMKKSRLASASFSIGGRGGESSRRKEARDQSEENDESDEDMGYGLFGGGGDAGDDGTMLEPQPELDFQESAIEETGFTTTYDLPGLKTLPPRSNASKQRVARISFANVVFSHTVVAKYKPAAYLKAKLKNTSKLTLLKGPAGLTLDGSFMGRTSLPRCSAGDTFTMSLGVDPAIRVVYPKPDVRRATTGLFSKEDSSVYTRSVTVANTRATAGKPVTLLVLDQVPVSEDERLRVDVLAPRGMTLGGAGVATGVPGRESGQDKDWGRATAQLKKGGEVCWDVSLNPGKAVKLALEYVVALPSADVVVQC